MYVAQHIAQKISEINADDSDSESEVRSKKCKPKWTKGLSLGEQMFCMALAQEDNYSDVEDADDEEIRYYKRKIKRTAKQLKGKWGTVRTPAPPRSVTPKKKRRLPRFVGTTTGFTFDFKKLK